ASSTASHRQTVLALVVFLAIPAALTLLGIAGGSEVLVVAGVVATALLGSFAAVTLRRARGVERLAAERTAELMRTNDRLQTQVAERHAAEAALAEQRALFQRVIDASPTLTFIKDRDGVFLMAN